MTQSPLDLRFYGIEEFSFDVNKKVKSLKDLWHSADSVTTEVGHMIREGDNNLHKLELKIAITQKGKESPPYKIKITMVGLFATDASWGEDRAAMLVQINGASMLYGAAREYIFSSTAHGKFGPYMLPSISFRPPPQIEE